MVSKERGVLARTPTYIGGAFAGVRLEKTAAAVAAIAAFSPLFLTAVRKERCHPAISAIDARNHTYLLSLAKLGSWAAWHGGDWMIGAALIGGA